jgi:hypothetical protein
MPEVIENQSYPSAAGDGKDIRGMKTDAVL